MGDVDEDDLRHIPVEPDYQWPPIANVEDHKRATVDHLGRAWIDGHRVTITMYRQFGDEWCEFYEARDPVTG